MKRPEQEKKVKVSNRLAQLIQRNRIIFILLGLAVIIFPIVYYIVDTVGRNAFMEATQKAHDVEQKFADYGRETDKEKQTAIEKELFALIDETASRFGGYYAGSRARFIRAALNREKLKEEGREDRVDLVKSIVSDYTEIEAGTGYSVIAPAALLQAASIIQNIPDLLPAGESDSLSLTPGEIKKVIPERLLADSASAPESFQDIALVLYQFIVEHHPDSEHVPEALINIGAISEAKKLYQEAAGIYDRLESDYSNNDWTKLAINRKIALQSEGLLAE